MEIKDNKNLSQMILNLKIINKNFKICKCEKCDG